MMNKIKNKIKDFLVNTFSVNLVLIIALIILIPKSYSKPIPPGSERVTFQQIFYFF